jgi:hypothetical protein
MAVEKYDCRGVHFECPLDDDPGVNGGAVDRALQQFLDGANTVAVVQEQTTEHLVAPVAQREAQAGAGVFGVAQRQTGPVAFGQGGQGEADQRVGLGRGDVVRREVGEAVGRCRPQWS